MASMFLDIYAMQGLVYLAYDDSDNNAHHDRDGGC